MCAMAFHKKANKKYVQYTLRIEEELLDTIKKISKKEDISINECFNQCLRFSINNYKDSK